MPLYLRETGRRISRRLSIGRVAAWRVFGKAPDRLIVAPTDLRIADPYIAHEIHTGRFPLAGRVLETDGQSPFLMVGPSEGFDESLHSFRWLRHLRAANTNDAFADAKKLTEDWINSWGKSKVGIAWQPDVTAQRLLAWLSHSPIILKNQDRGFYKRFIRSIAQQTRYLRRMAPVMRDGEARFRVHMALAMATLATPASPSAIKAAARNLDAELEKQILPDGGHVSRNPQVNMTLLADLLPLRQTYLNLGHTPPKGLVPSIDRMFQALRFFRHTDGTLALFNGATAQPADRLLSVLRYDEAGGEPLKHTPQMKYQRLANRKTIVIADTGPPPPGELSATAHAGCLSFEMSCGRNRFIVNCGAPAYYQPSYAKLARSTAAHSTLTVADTSSAAVSNSSFLGPVIVSGPANVEVERRDDDSGRQGFIAKHDGFAERFGLVHERSLQLSAEGNVLSGRDRLAKSSRYDLSIARDTPAAIRFHIHPKIQLSHDKNNDIVLTASDGEFWTFYSPDVAAEIEEDIFFADLAGPRRSAQIVVNLVISQKSEIAWTFVRSVPKTRGRSKENPS